MRPEDLGSFFEDAFNRLEPKDEAQRKKIEALRAKIAESQSKMADELNRVMKQQEVLLRPDPRQSAAIERSEIARQTRREMAAAFEEQAAIVESFLKPQ